MEFAILGPCEVRNSGQLIELRRGLPPALLTMLLVSRRAALPADVIADRLWGEDLPANPRNAVQQLVGYLRRALGPDGASLLVTRASRYALMAEDEDVDVRVFERLVGQAVEQASDGTARGARDALTAADAALALWRGDPLADIAAHEWAEPEVARLEESALRAREARVTALLTLGHHADDIITTFMLNLFFVGQLKAMPPVLRSDDGRNTVIRPLAYCRETDISVYAAEREFPLIPCDLCGSQTDLKRARMKRLIKELEGEIPNVRASMLTALTNAVPSHLLDPKLFDFKRLRAVTGDVEAELDAALGHTDAPDSPALVSIASN